MRHDKIKVLYLITKSNWGGAQRYVHDLVAHLPKDQFECVVALGGNGPLRKKIEDLGVRTIEIGGLQRNISLFKELRSIWKIAQLIRSEDPDVFHVNSSKAGGIGTFLGRVLGVPKVIFTAHGWAFNEDRPWVARLIIKFFHWLTVLFSHTTIAVSETLKSQLQWPGAARKMVVVHNGRTIDTFYERTIARQKITEHYPPLQSYADDFWSVTIGELHPIKQHDVTIRALAEVVKAQPTVRHIIISAGEERNNLEQQITELNMAEHVFLVGAIDEAARYLKAFDLFVLSSRSEAFAYVVIEALAASLPVISSEVGGVPEIIVNNQNGLLYPAGNVSALSNLYATLYGDESIRKRLSEAGFKRSQDFTQERCLTETIALYVH